MITNIVSIIAAIILTESGGNPAAVGDSGRAIGPAQMWTVQVDEVNRIMKKPVYTYADRKDTEKSKEMMGIFLTYWAPRRKATTPATIANLWRNPSGKQVGWYQKRFTKHYTRIINETTNN